MADKSIAVQNFRWGLESRRSELITQAGALSSIVDGHINSGGEIEQRLAFVLKNSFYTITDSLGDQGLFGLEAIDGGLVTFGSALAFGSTVTFGQPTLSGPIAFSSPNISYQQLMHPEIWDSVKLAPRVTIPPGAANYSGGGTVAYTGLIVGYDYAWTKGANDTSIVCNGITYSATGVFTAGATTATGNGTIAAAVTATLVQLTLNPSITYDRTKHRITSIVYSCNFEGKAVALAKFSDGNTFLYYNGSLVDHSRNGRVTANMISLQNLSTDLARQVFALPSNPNWFSEPNRGGAGFPDNGGTGATRIYSPASVYFGIEGARKAASSGQVGTLIIDTDGNGTSGTPAAVSFTIGGVASTTGTFTITAPKSNTDSTVVTLLTWTAISPTNTAATPAQCATALANALNRLASNNSYYAVSNGAVLTIHSPADWGNFTGQLTITCTDGAVTFVAAAVIVAVLGIQCNDVSIVDIVNNNQSTKNVVGSAVAIVSGGTPPYLYTWSYFKGDTAIVVGNTTADIGSQTMSFSKVLARNTATQGTFKCHVKDSAGAPLTGDAYFNVYLELDTNN